MVYGYKTNKEFIDKSYQLLEKLEKKNLWNKDTLVIGLDKSVRPLTYALRKLSKEESRETPDIRFFNYSSHRKISDKEIEESEFIRPIDSAFLSKYNNILILDDHAWSGNSLKNIKKIIQKKTNNSSINLACLQNMSRKDKTDKSSDLIYVHDVAEKDRRLAYSHDTGIEDKRIRRRLFGSKLKSITRNQSQRVRGKFEYNFFHQNRRQISKDIKEYLHEKHPKQIKKSGVLEKIVSGIFAFSFLFGLFLSSNNLIGNIVGTFNIKNNFLGLILIVIGITGFLIRKKFSKK